MNKDQIIKINKRSFITVCIILIALILFSYLLTYLIPKGYYPVDETGHVLSDHYLPLEGTGYSFGKLITAPFRLLASRDGLIVIVIAVFIVIVGGAFNVMDKTKGISSIIGYLITKYRKRKYLLMYLIILLFMLFGALFGIFEESVTMLPIIIMLALSLGWDTFTGLGMCLMAAGFGFSTALTNPFSVGLASSEMGINMLSGIGFRIIIFILMYLLLCFYMRRHVRKIEKNPESSLTYEEDKIKREQLDQVSFNTIKPKVLKVYTGFFISIVLIIIASALIPVLKGYSIPILAVAFLIGTFVCGRLIGYRFSEIGKTFLSGLLAVSPAVIMIVLAGTIKFILDDAQILATIIEEISNMFKGSSPILGILFIYFVILIVEFFIGSASAKVVLIIPIIKVLADKIGITPNIAVLAFIFGDGYNDLIYPTNPVLLIALGIAGFSYTKWAKKTIGLQLIVLAVTALLLVIGYYIGY
ncbi:MAG: Na+/H+ antiporter NhaC family protein [Bacilli bacterium]|nr:Na+/H+ antiporter NhaC family protein [Bacilli bacterium]